MESLVIGRSEMLVNSDGAFGVVVRKQRWRRRLNEKRGAEVRLEEVVKRRRLSRRGDGGVRVGAAETCGGCTGGDRCG